MSILSTAVNTASGSTMWIALGAFLVGSGVGGYGAYHWQEVALQREQIAHVTDMKAVSDAAAQAEAQHQADQAALVAKLAAADAEHFQELTNVKAENDSLRAAAAAGSLSIATSPADGGCGVPVPAAPAKLGHGPARRRAIIDPGAAKTLVSIAAVADKYRAQLVELQAYARAISAPAH